MSALLLSDDGKCFLGLAKMTRPPTIASASCHDRKSGGIRHSYSRRPLLFFLCSQCRLSNWLMRRDFTSGTITISITTNCHPAYRSTGTTTIITTRLLASTGSRSTTS